VLAEADPAAAAAAAAAGNVVGDLGVSAGTFVNGEFKMFQHHMDAEQAEEAGLGG